MDFGGNTDKIIMDLVVVRMGSKSVWARDRKEGRSDCERDCMDFGGNIKKCIKKFF